MEGFVLAIALMSAPYQNEVRVVRDQGARWSVLPRERDAVAELCDKELPFFHQVTRIPIGYVSHTAVSCVSREDASIMIYCNVYSCMWMKLDVSPFNIINALESYTNNTERKENDE